MLSRLDPPVWMTVEDADEKLYPNSYIMIHCEVDTGLAIAGYLVAYAPLKNGGVLSDLKHELAQSGENGVVKIGITKDPLDGGSLLVEYYEAN